MTEREAFEAWCRENGHPVGIRTDGSYVGSTETRFGAWQAATLAERARVAKRCAEIADVCFFPDSAAALIRDEFPEAAK